MEWRSIGAFVLVLGLAIVCIVSGMEGSAGRVLAVVFVPDKLIVSTSS